MNTRKRAKSGIAIEEPLIFERSVPGRRACSLPPSDVPERAPESLLDEKYLRAEIEGFPELSEVDVVQHFTRISTYNYHIDMGIYPLGSCTMKYNPKINEAVARLDQLASSHPMQSQEQVQGNLRLLWTLERCLAEITGMDEVTLQPAAGAHGELTGILMIRAFHEARGGARRLVLIPDSAHGTNPATAAMAGYSVRTIRSNGRGTMDLEDLAANMTEEVACLMLTNPNTLGIFEDKIKEVAAIVHAKGGLIYMDGANLNAMLGIARPGDFGVDCLHLNLHKTFSTPHGGGGPGAGPVAVKAGLAPYLPVPRIEKAEDGSFRLNYDRPDSIGRVRAFFGNFGVLVRALAYILTCGPDGLRKLSEHAVLNANYIRKRLESYYDLPFKTPTLHEVVFSDKLQNKSGVQTMDIAKRLLDYGFHPPTIYFPLIVPGALMIEPTESPGREELDAFIDAMISIAEEAREDPQMLKGAPHRTRRRRFDEAAAARKPLLRWRPSREADECR